METLARSVFAYSELKLDRLHARSVWGIEPSRFIHEIEFSILIFMIPETFLKIHKPDIFCICEQEYLSLQRLGQQASLDKNRVYSFSKVRI